MTKRFKLTPDLTCPELDGYRLPPLPEKTEFTIDDIRNAFLAGIAITGEGFNGEYCGGNNPDIEGEFGEYADQYIASLRTPRIPIAIEVEMEYTCCKRYINCIGCDATEDMIQPIKPVTNPDGTVKGVWVYE